MITIAVLIPTFEEEARLPSTLISLKAQSAPAERLIVVDADSRDRTRDVAKVAGVDIVHTTEVRGRGNQIALGLERSDEDVILIAHADMRFSPDALARIRSYLAKDSACPGGCLGHRFDSSRWIARVIEWCDLRRARRGLSYGDQAQFFRRGALESVGGFPAQPIMEDVELAGRLRKCGRPVYLDCPVFVSPRRFERQGWMRTLLQNWRYRRAYRRGGIEATRAIHERYYAQLVEHECSTEERRGNE